MLNYKIEIQYDGTKYNGWQKQGNTLNTIQGKFEAILNKMTDKNIEIHGSGRTDAGVHAVCQIANFKCDVNMSTDEIKTYINHYLPTDIAVIDISVVPDRFHSRLNAKEKIYRYSITNVRKPDVFKRKFTYYVEEKLQLDKMIEASKYFIGEHDFKAFCSNKHFKKSTVRKIYSIDITENNGEIEILYRGNGFLYNMVRIMTGTLIEVGLGKREASDMKNIIEQKQRELAGYTAPPQGLFLEKVIY